jgi:hypothetical protein
LSFVSSGNKTILLLKFKKIPLYFYIFSRIGRIFNKGEQLRGSCSGEFGAILFKIYTPPVEDLDTIFHRGSMHFKWISQLGNSFLKSIHPL